MKLAVRLLLCLIALGMFVALRGYAFLLGSGADNYASTVYTQYGASATATGTAIATPTATATQTIAATPTATATATPAVGALPLAITAMLGDQETGVTNPLPTLCAASTVSVPNGGTSSGACTTAGSVSTANIPTNGTDASSALQIAVNAGDVNLPAATYTINTQVVIPSWRTIQCQPGAVITTTATTIKVFSFSNAQSDMVVGCTFTGPGNVATLSPAYAIFISGGQNIDVVGNTFTGWPSASAVTVSTGTDDLFELNSFSGNHDSGLNTSGSTHIVNNLNNIAGTLTPKIPSITHTGGTQRERDLWTLFDALGASGTPAAAGYSVVQPGNVFTGATCHGDGSSDDTSCIVNALAASTTGILLTPATYDITAGDISGGQLNGKTVLCEPGARFFNPTTHTSGSPGHIFNIGWSLSGGSNINFLGCEFFGVYSNGPPPGSETANYSEMIEIGSQQSPASTQVHTIGDDFEKCAGDCWISYSPCGTSNTGTCSHLPSDSGPNDLSVLFSNFNGSNQNCIHLNGGQNQHILLNQLTDCSIQPEVDTNVFQIIAADEQHNYLYSVYGQWDTTSSLFKYTRPFIESGGRTQAGANYSGMFVYDNVADGSKTQSVAGWVYSGDDTNGTTSGTFLYPAIAKGLSVSSACSPGTFSGARGVNNGVIRDNGC